MELEVMLDNLIPQTLALPHCRQPADHGIADRKTLSMDAVFFTSLQRVSVVAVRISGLVPPRFGAQYHALDTHQDRDDRRLLRLPSLFGTTVEGIEERQTYYGEFGQLMRILTSACVTTYLCHRHRDWD